MRDCVNAAMRDRLPDLVHDLLPAGEREAVLAHVSACADCAAEVELLRDLRIALDHTPAVNVSRIVAALPRDVILSAPPVILSEAKDLAPADPKVVSLASRRRPRRMLSWQAAAAIATLMVGGSSIGILARQRQEQPARVGDSLAAASAPSAPTGSVAVTSPSSAPAAARPGSTTVKPAEVELAADPLLAEASDAELAALIQEIDRFDGTPSAEPEPVAPGTTTSTTSTPGSTVR